MGVRGSGTGSVAGVVLLPAGHKKSFFQATAEHLLPTGAMLLLLEAQAATCTLVDPATGRQLRVDEAVRAGLVGPELHRQLQVAEQAVMGYHDPFSGTRASERRGILWRWRGPSGLRWVWRNGRGPHLEPEARRGSQGASRAAPGKSGLHARGEGERVLALESREGGSAPSCCAFTHRVAFEEGSGRIQPP